MAGILDSLDGLGETFLGGVNKVLDAVGTYTAKEILSESDKDAQAVNVDTTEVENTSTKLLPQIGGFLMENPSNIAIMAVGAVAIYFVMRK